MDMVLPPDFKEFLKLLSDRNIQYLLIGGYAVGYHGYPRSTNMIVYIPKYIKFHFLKTWFQTMLEL